MDPWRLTLVILLGLVLLKQLYHYGQKKGLESSGSRIIRYAVSEDTEGKVYNITRFSPFIFVGAALVMPEAMMLKSMLENQPEIRCTRFPTFLATMLTSRKKWYKSKIERERLIEAGVFPEVIHSAYVAQILETMAGIDGSGGQLCAVGFPVLENVEYLAFLLPNAKFVHINPDNHGQQYNSMNPPRDGLKANQQMFATCMRLGPSRCKEISRSAMRKYPKKIGREVMESFLNLNFSQPIKLDRSRDYYDDLQPGAMQAAFR